MASFSQRFRAASCTQRVLTLFIFGSIPVSICIGKGIEHLQDKTNRLSLIYRDYRLKQIILAERVRKETANVNDIIRQIQQTIDASKTIPLLHDNQQSCYLYGDDMLTVENELKKLRLSNEAMISLFEDITYDNDFDPL